MKYVDVIKTVLRSIVIKKATNLSYTRSPKIISLGQCKTCPYVTVFLLWYYVSRREEKKSFEMCLFPLRLFRKKDGDPAVACQSLERRQICFAVGSFANVLCALTLE